MCFVRIEVARASGSATSVRVVFARLALQANPCLGIRTRNWLELLTVIHFGGS